MRRQVGRVSSLKTHTFDWGKLGQFYLTMVAPYVLTYAGLYAVDLFVPDLLGAFLDAALVVASPGLVVRFHSDDYFSSGVSCFKIPDSFSSLT